MNRKILKIFFVFLIALNLTAATGFVKPCAMPCCVDKQATQVISDCDKCDPASLSAPKHDCCTVQNGGASSLTTLNTWTAATDSPVAIVAAKSLPARAMIAGLAGSLGTPSGEFESPPIYLLTSSFLC